MRYLVVGTVPPPGGARALRLAEVASALAGPDDEVVILSPDLRSAAHRHARLSGLWLALYLAYYSRRFDGLVLRVERGVPFPPHISRLGRAVVFVALGAVLARWRDVTYRIDHPMPFPVGPGGRTTIAFWRAAGSIVVADDEDVARLAAVPGLDATRIVVEADVPTRPDGGLDAWELDGGGDLREKVLALVRLRAERVRRVASGLAALDDEDEPALSNPDPFAQGRVTPSLSGLVPWVYARGLGAIRRRLAREDWQR